MITAPVRDKVGHHGPVIDRLGALDAEFLHVEDGVGHMHIAGACTFDGPPPTFDEVEQMVRSKMHLIPRYRQRVRSVPFELGRPIWVDDPHFDLRYHRRDGGLVIGVRSSRRWLRSTR